ncbi:hypothetical protein LCGC14_0148700 [marine sediment metagenome]|uniref:Uncharacterized protein n=1 Tax=marine sediment metagenome TaxID=412755 RepID=A0A0F9XH36_9ZZZZ|nr:hypothetical protein [Maribacter sp.]HDZ06344.1 hypothetical protein [Maribacter sp.]HEA79617.1 hypothetical protein [Maribacter sp.]
MELHNIEKLIEKYFEATTTVADEEMLKAYFSEDDIAPHLEQYAPLFNYLSKAKEERFTKQVPLKPRRDYLKWVSVAAIAIFMVGVYFYQPTPPPVTLADEYTQEEIESAKEAFALLAMNFNKGTEQLYHLEEFEKTTNKFLTKNN